MITRTPKFHTKANTHSYLVSAHARLDGFPGGGRGRNLLVSCSGRKVALRGRGILLLLPDEDDRDSGSSRSDDSRSLGSALGRLSQDSDGDGEWVGEPGTGLLQRCCLSATLKSRMLGESRKMAGSRMGMRLNLGDNGESLGRRTAGGGEEETVAVVSACGCWCGSRERSGRPESLSGSLSLVR